MRLQPQPSALTQDGGWELAEWPHRRSTPLSDIVNRSLVLVVNLIINLQIRHDNKSAWIVALLIISLSTFKQISPFQQREERNTIRMSPEPMPVTLTLSNSKSNMLISNTVGSSNSITAM